MMLEQRRQCKITDSEIVNLLQKLRLIGSA